MLNFINSHPPAYSFSSKVDQEMFQKIYNGSVKLYNTTAATQANYQELKVKILKLVSFFINYETTYLDNPHSPIHEERNSTSLSHLQERVSKLKEIQEALSIEATSEVQKRVEESAKKLLNIFQEVKQGINSLNAKVKAETEAELLKYGWIPTEGTKTNPLIEMKFVFNKGHTSITGTYILFDTPQKFDSYQNTRFIQGAGNNSLGTFEGLFTIDTQQLLEGSIKLNTGGSLNGLFDLRTGKLIEGEFIFPNGMRRKGMFDRVNGFPIGVDEYSETGALIKKATYHPQTGRLISERLASNLDLEFIYDLEGNLAEWKQYDPSSNSLLQTKSGVFDSEKRFLSGTHTTFFKPSHPYRSISYAGTFDVLTGLSVERVGRKEYASGRIALGEFDSQGELVAGIDFDGNLYRIILDKKEIFNRPSLENRHVTCQNLWHSKDIKKDDLFFQKFPSALIAFKAHYGEGT